MKHGHAIEAIGILVTNDDTLLRIAPERVAVSEHLSVFDEIDNKARHLFDQGPNARLDVSNSTSRPAKAVSPIVTEPMPFCERKGRTSSQSWNG